MIISCTYKKGKLKNYSLFGRLIPVLLFNLLKMDFKAKSSDSDWV